MGLRWVCVSWLLLPRGVKGGLALGFSLVSLAGKGRRVVFHVLLRIAMGVEWHDVVMYSMYWSSCGYMVMVIMRLAVE